MMPFFVQAQLSYQPVILSQCSNEELDFYTVTITGKGEKYKSFDNSLELARKVIEIKDTGTYQLNIGMISAREFISQTIHFKSFKAYTDTFNVQALIYNRCVCSPPAENYFWCGEDPHGQVTDYYYDGSVRARGNFDNGYIIDTLQEYYRNGQLKSLRVKLKGTKNSFGNKVTLWDVKDFSKEGILVHHYNNKKEFIKDYYSSGQLKKHNKFKGKTWEYYEWGEPESMINKRGNKKTIYSREGQKVYMYIKNGSAIEKKSFGKDKRRVKVSKDHELGSDGFPVRQKF